jgi:hypothetical protein
LVALLAALVAPALAGCVPEFDDTESLIDERRIIALPATPAEVDLRRVGVPGDITLEAVVADRLDRGEPNVVWTLCTDRKPLSELGPVSERCLAGPDLPEDVGIVLGRGATISATVPENACQLFGPERPDPEPGKPAGRPVDPDATGGFYQPVLAWLDGKVVLSGIRINCGLLHVPPEISTDYAARYSLNENPVIDRLEFLGGDGSVAASVENGGDATLQAGGTYTIRAMWAACPSTSSSDEPGCTGAESYVVYDPATFVLDEKSEALVVAWYATDGRFDSERTGPKTGGGPGSENRFSAPSGGAVRLWAVLRDDRGGISSFQADLQLAD